MACDVEKDKGTDAKTEESTPMVAPLTSLKAGKHVEEIMQGQMKEAGSPHLLPLSTSTEGKVAAFASTLASLDTAPIPRCHHRKSAQVLLRTFRLRHSHAQASGTPWLP